MRPVKNDFPYAYKALPTDHINHIARLATVWPLAIKAGQEPAWPKVYVTVYVGVGCIHVRKAAQADRRRYPKPTRKGTDER